MEEDIVDGNIKGRAKVYDAEGKCVPDWGGEAAAWTGDFEAAFVFASGEELPMVRAGKRNGPRRDCKTVFVVLAQPRPYTRCRPRDGSRGPDGGGLL
jgi:hypothetical protein